MAVPSFGQFNRNERVASWLLFLVGVVGLVFTVTGVFEAVGAGAIGEASPRWFSWNPWRGWLIIQSLVLANAGYLAAIGTRRFGLVLAGIIAGLLVITPIGVLAVFPSLWLLRLVIRARSSFDLFSPRQPEFPWGPTFEEKIGERPALLIHVRMGAVPGEDAALFEAVQRALRAVDCVGGQYLGAQYRSDLAEWTFYLCAQEIAGPGPEELLAEVGPALQRAIGTVEWRGEKRYATSSGNVNKKGISEPDAATDRGPM